MAKKTGRNDPCPCGSGKKFKKCCEGKMIGKKFMAHKVEGTSLAQKIAEAAGGVSSFFKNKTVMPLAKKKEDSFTPVGMDEYLESQKEPTVPQEPLEPLPGVEEKKEETP